MASVNADIVAAYHAARDVAWAVWSFDNTCRNWHPDRWANATDFSNCLPVVELEHVPTKADRCADLLHDAKAIREGLITLTGILSLEEVARKLVMATPRPATIASHHQGCFAFAAWSVAADRYESVFAFQENRNYTPLVPSPNREDFPPICGGAITPENLDDFLRGAGIPDKWDIDLASMELQKEAERAIGEPIATFAEAMAKSAAGKRSGGRPPSDLSKAILSAVERGDHVDDIAIHLNTTRDNIRKVVGRNRPKA